MGKEKPVLIIEDDRDIQDSLKIILEYEGYLVFTANQGQQALDLLKHIPLPGLILLDLMMPVMNGWGLAQEVEKDPNLSQVPIIVLSAFPDKSAPIKAKSVLQKPVDLTHLIEVVNTYYS